MPVIYFRSELTTEAEASAAEFAGFDLIRNRAALGDNRDRHPRLVIPRYSMLPFARELEMDMHDLGHRLINSYHQHCWVADIASWYPHLAHLTPKTWFRASDVPMDMLGPFVLKGSTNSVKTKWRTHMFAQTRQDVAQVLLNLMDDPVVGQQQGVVVRQFESFAPPLGATEPVVNPITGQPIVDEYRFFLLDGRILASGFYWSDYEKAAEHEPAPTDAAHFVTAHVVPALADAGSHAPRFIVVDVARRVGGEWRVVELNDGTMSGLSCISPDIFYGQLYARLR